jgi:monoterpene epsilon-lactone hydrolase
MASLESEAIKNFYRDLVEVLTKNPELGIEEIREMFEHWGDLTAEPGGIDYSEVDAGGVLAMWASPHDGTDSRILVCLHGGGYTSASMYSHRKLYGHLAKAVRCRALILNVRRAPEHPHPAAVEDATAAYAWLLDQGYHPKHIAAVGDSGGGGLAVALLVSARERGLPLPAAAMSLSGWFDMELTGQSMIDNEGKDLSMTRASVDATASVFLGTASRQDPLANLYFADLSGLPPLFLQVGEDELLLDDARGLADRAHAAGVQCRLDVWPEMQHVHQMMAGRAPEADAAIADLAEWIRPKLGV